MKRAGGLIFIVIVIVVSLRLSFNLFVDVKMKVPVIVAATAEICSTTEPLKSSVQSEDVRF